jgi:hypothetical protein
MSRNHQSAQAVWIFHRVVPGLVLRTISVMRQVHKTFEAFDDPDQDLAQFVELRIFSRCDQLLVPWLCGIEPSQTRHSKTLIRPSCKGIESFWILEFLSD